ncbi:P-loop containing nucleoside triphosphate hydrolase protein [Dichotomocladium elegans]|nr:P-loop containing nucleoside triphosphate hydrolase protein [Dichotomocladium elegans]
MNFPHQGMPYMPNQAMRFPPGQQPIPYQQRPPPHPHHLMAQHPGHPGIMYNNAAAAALMQQQSMQQGVRPMPPNSQFMNAFPRPANGYPMPPQPGPGPSHLNPYQMQQLQHRQFIAQQHHIAQQQQQFHHTQIHQQQIQRPAPPPPPPRPKRSTRNTKKKVTYDESSDEEEDLGFLSEESEQQDSEFEDDDDSGYKKKKKKAVQAREMPDPDDGVVIPIGTKVFERILDYRQNDETGEEELLVKYKNMSFRHVEWVPLEQIEGEHLGKHRVKKFLKKWNDDGQKGEDYRDYLQVDRVIDEGELEDPNTGENKIYFLVKWNGQFYDQSTWETEDDLRKIDPVKIDEFHNRRQIPQQKLANPPQRPVHMVTPFVHYDRSPMYRYGNELRSYQLEGLNWLRFCYYNFRSCILADEMGLGKTVQSVAFLNDIYYNLGIRGPFLIVAPLSTVPHWIRALNAWTDLNVVDFRGSTMARNLIVETEFNYRDMEGNLIPNRFKFDVLVTTYEMASAGAPVLRDIQWRCGVFDEAHRLKNKQSKVLEILKTFYIEHKLLLTGTPLQNNLDELYSLLNFMQPEIFNDERLFFAEFGSLQTAAQVERLQALLKPIMLRRFKEDVEKTIPVKEETVIEVELTTPQKKWYRAILEKNFSFLKKSMKTNKEMPHLRNIMMQLRKCCIHPYLLEGAEEVILSECHATGPREQFNCLVQSSGKLVLIDKLLKKLILGNHKVLIFSQFTSCLDILADYLRGRQYAYERIDGSVPGDQRQAAIDRFTTLPIEESFVFLLCTRAGGVGINLTAADTCIIFDSDWNPQNDLQAQARCHRIGQTKPVQIYRLICRNTYEKDMFDRAGIKLGLDRAVMQRSGPTINEDGAGKSELTKKEIEDLLKKGAYGAMLDDEASTKFCEEDIDQILERRTRVIRHEGNEKGSVFSKATFSATEDNMGVEIDDPDFWEKWAAKANIEASEEVDENNLIVIEPRRRRAVQRFGSRPVDGSYSDNDNADDSDAYEEEQERGGRKRDQMRPWSLSEKTKYERKLMIYGYGRWDLMKPHFPRRTEKDLKAVTRALMRKVVPTVEKNNDEDRKLVEDIEYILESDCRDEVRGDRTVPYSGATKKQISEFRSFLIEAPADYVEHIERKGRNFLLRIQMLYLIRDKIVPKRWEEAKALVMPKVTGSAPSTWWSEVEDRDLLLGIYKHGYQQYLSMRNDPEFCFYGRKYDDSRAGSLDDDDNEKPMSNGKKEDEDSDNEDDKDYKPTDTADDDGQVYVWPTKADIGMRLRRIIAAFLREQANDAKKRRLHEKEEKREQDRKSRARDRESRLAQRQKAKMQDASNRWTKKNKSDFLRTILSFGIESQREDPHDRWKRFKELAGLEKKTDESLDLYLTKFRASCEEVLERHKREQAEQQEKQKAEDTNGTGEDGRKDDPTKCLDGSTSRESSIEPPGSPSMQDEQAGGSNGDRDDHGGADLVPYDKARRAIKRIIQMNMIREQVMAHPDLDALLQNGRKTSGLPTWWEVPLHDKGLLQGICKHGVGRNDLIINDPELPFLAVKDEILKEKPLPESNEEGFSAIIERISWPKDLVIARRIDALCDLVLHPKPPPKRPASSRKRKVVDKKRADLSSKNVEGTNSVSGGGVSEEQGYQSDDVGYDGYSDSGDDTDSLPDEAILGARKRLKQSLPVPGSQNTEAGSAEVSDEEEEAISGDDAGAIAYSAEVSMINESQPPADEKDEDVAMTSSGNV